jgi:ABC-type multidrug transport system fused ATPase/permease subunit
MRRRLQESVRVFAENTSYPAGRGKTPTRAGFPSKSNLRYSFFRCQVLGKVEFRKVSFAYPTRPNTLVLKVSPSSIHHFEYRRLLQDLSFIVRPGELVALVGPSGAGKSSVISLLEHFYEPLRGEILLDDVPIEQYEHRFFHQKVSRIMF